MQDLRRGARPWCVVAHLPKSRCESEIPLSQFLLLTGFFFFLEFLEPVSGVLYAIDVKTRLAS